MKSDIERRGGTPANIREQEQDILVDGYAAVFGEKVSIGGLFDEVIERGAFADAVGRDDVVFLINHDGLPLARTRSKTLELKEDERGLFMATKLNTADPDVQSIIPKMQRGDLDKMSFAFIPEIEEWDETQDPPLRTIKKASLRDVSIVTQPAYDGTSIGLRSLEQHLAGKKQNNHEAAKRRLSKKIDLDVRERGGR